MAENSIPMMPYGFQRAPTRTTKDTTLLDVLYSMGVPVWSRDSGMDGYFTINDWMNRNKAGAAAPAASEPPDPRALLPQYYRDWYDQSGKFGGIPLVQGLL